jgi:putative ABC transport system permease protein
MDNLVSANILQRPIRSLVSVAGVALGVALVLLFTGLSRGMSNDLQHRSSNLRAEIMFTRKGSMDSLTGSPANLNVLYAEKLKQVPGVESAIPVILYVSSGSKGFGLQQIEGVNWNDFAAMNQMTLISGRAPVADDEVVVDRTKAGADNLAPGSMLKLFGDKPYKVVGVYTPESGARVKMSLTAMQNALQAPDKCSYILVKAKPGTDEATLAKNIDTTLPGNKIQYTRDVFTSIEKSFPALKTFLRVLVVLAAVVSTLVIMLAMYTTITERTREIGILKALGASKWYIVSAIEKEALLISLLGLILGLVVSIAAGFLIHRIYGLIFEFGWGWILTAAAIGLFGGLVGAIYPAVRAANLDPVLALSYD